MATDFLVAEHIARAVGDRLGALVAPVLPFGYAPYHLDFAGTITLDADSTTCQTFGAKKKGTGWSHNGVRGYQPFVISWSERRRFLAADLLAANNNPVASSPRLLRRALTLLPDGADGVRLRGDSGFYSADLMVECAKKGVRFSICAKRTTVVWAEMLSIPKHAWRRAKDGTGR